MYKTGDVCFAILDKVHASNRSHEGKNKKQTGLLWSTGIGVDFTGVERKAEDSPCIKC